MGCGLSKAHIAAAMGHSRKCVRTWIARYEAEGEIGLHDRSSRPHTMPTRTPSVVEDQIVALRRLQRCGPDVIGAELGVAARTVSRVLRRRGVPDLRDCDPMTGEVIRASKTTAVRYERDRPGELVHMDVKKIGPHPRRRRLACPRPRHKHRAEIARPGSASTTCTRWSTTTPGWPTPRSSPTRKAPPARRSCAAPPPTSQPRHHPHRAGHDRQRLGLPLRRCASRRASSAPDRCSSSRTARGRTARSNASTAPCRPSGPTDRSSPPTPNAPPPLHPGSSTTTLDDATAHSEASRRSADCHQPDGRVHLGGFLVAEPLVVSGIVEDRERGVPDVGDLVAAALA